MQPFILTRKCLRKGCTNKEFQPSIPNSKSCVFVSLWHSISFEINLGQALVLSIKKCILKSLYRDKAEMILLCQKDPHVVLHLWQSCTVHAFICKVPWQIQRATKDQICMVNLQLRVKWMTRAQRLLFLWCEIALRGNFLSFFYIYCPRF